MSDFTWRGKKRRTIRDLMDALGALKTPEEAEEFIAAYREAEPHVADQNAGYLTGYFGGERAEQLREWMGTPHPVFGMESPTHREALLSGMAQGAGAKQETVRKAFP